MKIKMLRLSFVLLFITSVFVSCKDDDDDSGSTFVEADRTEQQLEDNAEILGYLNSHYYNSSFFESGTDHKYTDIVITELPVDVNGEYEDLPDPTNNTLLIDAVETRTTTYLEADYEYYVLNIVQGEGESPAFTDMIRVRYKGSSINEEIGGEEVVFDSAITPADLPLQGDGTNTPSIKAWQLILPTFNAASSFGIDENGSVNFTNPGLGVMFIPSGLAYFSGTGTGSTYDNLIFKFELLQFEVEDHDNDGIPSYIEDLNENLDVIDDDTDDDGLPNFVDRDDDGDDVLTIDELIPNEREFHEDDSEPTLNENEFELSRTEPDVDGNIVMKTVTIADSNNDGIPDYLDVNITINYNE